VNELKLEQLSLEIAKTKLQTAKEERYAKISEYIFNFSMKCITGFRLPFTALLILGLTNTISPKDVADIFKLIVTSIFEKPTNLSILLFISLIANVGLGIWIYIIRKNRIEDLALENARLKREIDSGRTSSNLQSIGVSRSEDT
jgi:hypothetical protein